MNPVIPVLNKPIQAAVILTTALAAATAFAIDQPPQEPEQQRAWLVGHLVTDMEALGTFDGNALAKVPGIVNSLTDDQVALLAQYYYLTRSKTEQDAGIYALQQQGHAEDQVNAAKAEIADLLTTMNDQIVACYDQFVPMPEPVQYISYVIYASVPGWCCHARCFVPEWYFDNGCYVGPCFNAAYAGIWGVPVWRAYYDHGSHFYGRYHSVANTVYVNRSINVAHRRADWFWHHGDWRSVVAHDRLLHRSATGYRSPPPRMAAGHVGGHSAPVHHSSEQFRAEQQHPNGNHNVVVHQQVAKPHVNHAATTRHPEAQHQAVKSHATHASAPHAHAAHVGHANAPRPQHSAHAHPHPEHVAQAHSGHARHK